MNIYRIFEEMAARYPEQAAIIDNEKAVSYAALETEINNYAAKLISLGISAGDRVLVFVPMNIRMYTVVLALFRIGATTVFLDEWVSWKRLNICCELADCKAFIAGPLIRLLGLFSSGVRKIPIKTGTGASQLATVINTVEVDATHPALITFTTGSTGIPKAALRSHGFLYQQYEVLKAEINTVPGAVFMTTLPILVLINMGSGITTVLPSKKDRNTDKMRPENINHLIDKYRISGIVSSPAFIEKIAVHNLNNDIKSRGIQKIFAGGAAVFPAAAKKMISAFPDAEIEIIYGSTEAEPIAAIPAARLAGDQELSALRGGLPAGKINNRIYLKIIKYTPGELSWDTMQEIIHSGIDQPGEIIVSGPHVLAQYFKNEDAFRKNKILDPAGNIWHRTGDAGYLNAAGELFLTGRCERIIYADGKIFSPFMYENKIAEVNGVIAGTLLRTGDKIAFVIEPEQGAVREKIKAEISRFNPANFDIIFIDKMPRDPRHQSKIDYQKLEELRVEN